MNMLWMMWLIGGVPALAAPVIWLGGLFAFLAQGVPDSQRFWILAGMLYPLVYLVCLIMSIGEMRGGDLVSARTTMKFAMGWIVAVLVTWPLFGIK